MTVHMFPTRSSDGERQNWIVVTQYLLIDLAIEITDVLIEAIGLLLPGTDRYCGITAQSLRYAFRIDDATVVEADVLARSVADSVIHFLRVSTTIPRDTYLAGEASVGSGVRFSSDTDPLMAVWSFALRPLDPPTQTLHAVE